MKHDAQSIRPFIGAKNYDDSRAFYRDMGFIEIELSANMCYYQIKDNLGFYLQQAYVKDWVDNSMLFLEVENTANHRNELLSLNLQEKYKKVRVSEIADNDWGREYFVHDPSGILWHIGQFYR